jgi:hypothetical protein
VTSSEVILDLASTADCQNEIVEAERKKELFEGAFERRLVIKSMKKAKGA